MRGASNKRLLRRAGLTAATISLSLLLPIRGALAQARGQTADTATEAVPADATPKSLFVDFLHYARLGRFTLADAYARALLAHPDLDPSRLVDIADKDPQALQTLLVLIKNSTIGENAARVLDVLHEGQRLQRQSTERIQRNIDLLGGDPQQEFFARRHLAESGEYAVPVMVATLLDKEKSDLWPRLVAALPVLGKPAVRPMVVALKSRDNTLRLDLVQALGRIGYPQAVPYLRRLAVTKGTPPQIKAAAIEAIKLIETQSGQTFTDSAADLFFELGERYYNEDDAVRADPRLAEANVWYWDEAAPGLRRVPVATPIFGQVMAMRCCQQTLRIRDDHAGAISLWLAANIRREGRLGMNVESGDPQEQGQNDPTRPDVFPRALYFTQAAGPFYAHLVLDRALEDQDSIVALGAIAALRLTAGEASLIGTEDYKQPLVQALQFPDLVVRIRAALALGAALPKSAFAGSQWVVPVLASALAQTGREQVIVVDADDANRSRVAAALRAADRDVIAGAGVFAALTRARQEFQTVSALFVATNVEDPDFSEAVAHLRDEFIYAKLPVVVLAEPDQMGAAKDLAKRDPYIESVPAFADEADLIDALRRVQSRTHQAPLDADLARSMALEAAETLRRIVVDGRTVYDVDPAEPALIGALSSTDQALQTLAASVIALLPSQTAQRAVAHVALDAGYDQSLRIEAFGSLAQSAKNYGNRLEQAQIDALVNLAQRDPDLTIRTAASQALGAINLTTNQASEIIRSYYLE